MPKVLALTPKPPSVAWCGIGGPPQLWRGFGGPLELRGGHDVAARITDIKFLPSGWRLLTAADDGRADASAPGGCGSFGALSGGRSKNRAFVIAERGASGLSLRLSTSSWRCRRLIQSMATRKRGR